MIVKIAPNRRDGKSSFKDLATYMTAGIAQSGEPAHKYSWENLTQYITKESVLNALGEDVEKTIGVEVGNVSSLENAPAEMYMTAKMAPLVENPVYHYILSWPEHERPRTEDIFSAARDTLKALGMEEHQYIIAIHANTDNLHAHIEVNRVNPRTFKAVDTFRDYVTLHRAAREAEIKYGWHHDNGIFQVVEVNGTKHVIKNTDYVDPDLVPMRPGAQKAEVWSGEESLETWCKREPATELKRLLKDGKAESWQDIHRVLARHSLELRDAGGGGMKVVDTSAPTEEKKGKPLAVSASAAFRFLKRADLEQRLGAFEPPSPETQQTEPTRSYKRDPYKRLEARLARKTLRDALHERFKGEQRLAKETQAIAKKALTPFQEDDRKRHEAIRQAHGNRRKQIRDDKALSPAQKQQAYMLAKLTADKARAQLIAQIRAERTVRRELLPPVPTWRQWVEDQAKQGDEAAISALRGMIYQEGRDRKKQDGAAEESTDGENAIVSAKPIDSDPNVRNFQNLIWKVSKNGRVSYDFASGEPAFRDEGQRITWGRKSVSDDAMLLSLRYSADKWRDGIRISGGDFVFKERVARMAVQEGIRILNPELKQLVQRIQHENEARAKLGAVPPAKDALAVAVQIGADIEQVVLSLDAKAKFQRAEVGSNKRYAGRVVAHSSDAIAQEVGRNDYVVHALKHFDRTPAVGENATIGYRAGKATLHATKAKATRNGR